MWRVVAVIQGASTTASTSAIREAGVPERRWATQHGGAADVVPDQGGLIQVPGLDELGEHLTVEADGNVLLLVALRLAVAQQIEGVDGEALGE